MKEAVGRRTRQPWPREIEQEQTEELIQGYLALINAALGNKESPQACFAQSQKYVETIRIDLLLVEEDQELTS